MSCVYIRRKMKKSSRDRAKFLVYCLTLLLSLWSFAQDKTIESVAYFLSNDIDKAQETASQISNLAEKTSVQWHLDAFKNGVTDSIVSGATEKTNYKVTVLELLKDAEIYQIHYFQKDSLIFENLKKSLTISRKQKDTTLIRLSYHKILKHLFRNIELYDLIHPYAEAFKPYMTSLQDEATYTYYKYASLLSRSDQDNSDKFLALLDKFETDEDHLTQGILNQIIGIIETAINSNHEQAITYFNTAINHYKHISGYTGKYYLFRANNNLGYAYSALGNYKKALEYYHIKPSIDFGKNNLLFESQQNWSLSLVFKNSKQFDSALYYAEKEKEVLKRYNEYESAIKQKEIETIYQTAEKEKQLLQKENELLIEQKKKKQNRNLFVAALTVLFFGSITGYLIHKNLKKKQLLTEQDKHLQIQKVATLLKEQELTAIDAMIEGQEKERQIIANDLHDDLGGLMATVKLHFEVLERKQSPEMFKKTNALLNEAYQKIRGIAHAKNSGVLASQGLLKAIKNMVKKISDVNNLHIEIIDYGLENRLENSLELMIFRIIQELIANTIKHAEATEMTIQITNHDHKINIVVEDNGKGFDVKEILKSSGMGINSIDKRVENLNGNVHIDSKINQGTSVIIDIPI